MHVVLLPFVPVIHFLHLFLHTDPLRFGVQPSFSPPLGSMHVVLLPFVPVIHFLHLFLPEVVVRYVLSLCGKFQYTLPNQSSILRFGLIQRHLFEIAKVPAQFLKDGIAHLLAPTSYLYNYFLPLLLHYEVVLQIHSPTREDASIRGFVPSTRTIPHGVV